MRRFVPITAAAFALAAAAACQADPPPPWETRAPGATAAEYLDSLPYDFHPDTGVCPTEAQVREAFPAMPAFARTEAEARTEALDTAVAVIDDGGSEPESLATVASGVECFFWIDDADFFYVSFGVYPFQEGADEWYADASGDTGFTLPDWDRASFSHTKNDENAAAPGALDEVRFALLRGQVVVYGGGSLANDGMTEEETALALFALAPVNAASLWED
ncbi:hypothetical protein [Glycomyces terrestris]|uniref:DUF3558 domain-containing protein n=1 Tax=Glycomyces terrestris TaxID=2493553 RepID=A0A426UV09_9ACTN|nr:hypothetical protein [Glycomyces terrestris]RRR98154.1 hypothetical protein EIW28_14635 [Glycomyces terrestris]